MRDVEPLGEIQQAGATIFRYGFQLDGPALAEYLRDRQQEALIRANKLPPGVQLSPSEQHRSMRGDGEVWIDADGFPVRQILNVYLPGSAEQGATRAEMTIDFRDFGPHAVAVPFAWQEFLRNAGETAGAAAPMSAGLVLGLLAFAALLRWRGSRRFAGALSIALIISIVGGPLGSA
ncbi:MAG: hypothetical protein HC822_24380, partial [Oscillochloris sp.]|nr:hypothetical protein [Oscillochloris sp.]